MLIVFAGIILPFIGTALGAAAVFILRKTNESLEKAMGGFASGVMVAASVWSLIIPGVEMSAGWGRLAFLPVVSGMAFSFLVMVLSERLIMKRQEGKTLQFFAVTVHNFPEGMAVGLMFALWLKGASGAGLAPCFAFSLAIALQNIPEGAIISMPCYSRGEKKSKAFLKGVVSGVVEPVGALLTLAATGFAQKVLPCLFGFAAGAMLYAVCEVLSGKDEKHPFAVSLCFGAGFCLMMTMDVALGQ